MKTRSNKNSIAILAVVLVAAIAIGVTLAYLNDSQSVTNTFTVGDLDIALEEPSYPTDPTKPNTPGTSYPKDPTTEAVVGDGYMRMVVEIIDTDSDARITDAGRLAKILKTLFYDPAGDFELGVIDENVPFALHYSESDLAGLPNFNLDDFIMDDSVPGLIVFEYDGIFTEGSIATLFTSVIIPCDWDQTDMQLLGNYKIVVQSQAIQSSNFANAAEAFAALDGAISGGTTLTDYGAVTLSPTEPEEEP